MPALLSWHEHHDVCRLAAVGAVIPSHVLVESFSVLTRLPAPHRLAGDVAQRLLAARFAARDVVVASATLQRSIVERAAGVGLEGGSVYDALVALVAAEHGHILLSRDVCAGRTYELLDVGYELLISRP